MNILHIAPYCPSKKATHAGGVCMGYEIEELQRNHNVYSIFFDQSMTNENKSLVGSEGYKISRKEKRINVFSNPFMANQFATRRSSGFTRRVLTLIDELRINAVHIEYAAMGQYIRAIKSKYPQIICNLVLHDVTYQSYQRQLHDEKSIAKKLYLSWQKRLILKDEKHYIALADNVLVFSEKDRVLVNQLYKRDDAIVINTFFDVDAAINKSNNRDYHQLENAVCFFGQMGREENNQAALRLVKIMNNSKLDVHAYIIGNRPSPELISLASSKVHITGFAEDPDIIMQNCKLAVFPLMVGAGIKIKVLHCMALGIPVITTEIGAEGIDEEGRTLQIAQSDEEYVQTISRYINDIGWQEENGKEEKRLINEKFLWSKTTEVFDKLYKTSV